MSLSNRTSPNAPASPSASLRFPSRARPDLLRAHRIRHLRLVLLGEAIVCLVASVIHAHLFHASAQPGRGGLAGLVPAVLLVIGLVVSAAHPQWTRTAAITVQRLALASILVAGMDVMTDVGPVMFIRLFYHLALILMLLWGMTAVKEGPSRPVLLHLQWKG